jgi:hypothetical protein
MSEIKSLCPNCSNSIKCSTWAEWKCTAKKRRIYGWKEMPCQCEDCLKNELLSEEREEV